MACMRLAVHISRRHSLLCVTMTDVAVAVAAAAIRMVARTVIVAKAGAAVVALKIAQRAVSVSQAMHVHLVAQKAAMVALVSVPRTAQRAVSVLQKTTARRAVHRQRRSNLFPVESLHRDFFFQI